MKHDSRMGPGSQPHGLPDGTRMEWRCFRCGVVFDPNVEDYVYSVAQVAYPMGSMICKKCRGQAEA